MAITKPLLPPKAGYVEVEIDGVRRYMNAETGEILGSEKPTALEQRIAELEAKNAALTTSNQFLEDCLVEMAGIVYA